MPYINKIDRQPIDEKLNELLDYLKTKDIISDSIPNPAGELNYIITKICLAYKDSHNESYVNYNEIIGVLECVKQEFYRRSVAKYEDYKILKNGDIY